MRKDRCCERGRRGQPTSVRCGQWMLDRCAVTQPMAEPAQPPCCRQLEYIGITSVGQSAACFFNVAVAAVDRMVDQLGFS